MTKVRRQPTDPQDWEVVSPPAEAAVELSELSPSAVAVTQEEQQVSSSPFNDMLVSEYHLALDKEIAKGKNKIMERFTRLMSQEKTPKDVKRDALGKSSDDYEDIVNAIQSGDPKVGTTKEDVYMYLKQFDFTEMRDLDAIKQEFQQ